MVFAGEAQKTHYFIRNDQFSKTDDFVKNDKFTE